jgi:steroid 5-alpha reductase family enzyme
MLSIATYIFSLIIILGITTLLFFIAQIKKDNSIMDIAYGPIFILAGYIAVVKRFGQDALAPASILILFLITLWGLRLSYRIYSKNKGKPEDSRYGAWRSSWMKKGLRYYYARAYLQIFILQGFVISIVLLPFTLSLTASPHAPTPLLLGLLVWIFGFCFEALGDRQLDTFITSKNIHKGTIMKTGLWKYTRHPNYFGEATMWFGLAYISISSGSSLAVILSPLLITYLLLFVSGIPMLEKKWEGNEEWEAYKKRTSAFVPWFPKSV